MLRVVLVVFGAGAGFMLPSLRLDSIVSPNGRSVCAWLFPICSTFWWSRWKPDLGLDQAIQHCARELEFAHKYT